MHITDFLMKYRKPFFAPESEGGSGGSSGGDAAGDTAAASGAETALGGDGAGAADGDKGGDAAAGEAEGDATKDGDDTGDKAGDDADKDKNEDAGDDAGEFKLTAPEGMEDFQGEFDTFSSEVSEWMQANPDATASDALKWAAEQQADKVAKQTQDVSEAFIKQIETWEAEAKADKDIGGDAFDANLATAKKAIDAFGDDALKTALNESGLGSHPAVIKFAVNAGKALSDAPVLKTNGGGAKKSLAESLYGKKD